MVIPENHKWMYNRAELGRSALSQEFIVGVEEFVNFACSNSPIYQSEGTIRCPCLKCHCGALLRPEVVKVHLYKKGFKPNYWYWIEHGEEEPHLMNIDSGRVQDIPVGQNEDVIGRYENMVYDAATTEFGDFHNFEESEEEHPNAEATEFYSLLNACSEPLWPGCETHSELSLAVRLLSLKSDYNISQACFDSLVDILREVAPPGARIPMNYYRTKKLVSKLGLASKKIDCCVNGCMLFNDNARQCKFCGADRYKSSKSFDKKKVEVPVQRMHYLPLIPRLKRLYSSMSSAEHMRWHAETNRKEGVMCHPSDGEAWKHFDRTYSDFAADPRNIRLGLCSDGFSPYNQSSSPYSCWPVIVTPYNLPPEMCMTAPYMFLTCIIPGPNNPKSKIDIYLQPLIDELKLLWAGVLTYDVATKRNFVMRAALMWTINDFPAYGMLSGWMTAGKLACPYCMEMTKAFTLRHGGKSCWFDCHRQFLPIDHMFRRNKYAFKKKTIATERPPPRLSGEDLSVIVSDYIKITDVPNIGKQPGYGIYHNWTKQSIFWELPYWKNNLLRHNLDVMHIEKNVFDNIFNTVMDVKGKTKDNLKARLDLKDICRRPELELIELSNGKVVKPKAAYTFSKEQKKLVCEWVKELKMPDGYASNLGRCVDMHQLRLHGMKSHDCHVFMESLLPVAFSLLPDPIWKALTELSQFFKQLCSTTVTVEDMSQLEQNIPVILCKLERIFLPGFFDSMEHLPIHLPYEARVGGPVQYRWMYPFERYLNKIKKTVKNKARVEGSICEAYLTQEISHFCSYYFESHVKSIRSRAPRNDDAQESMFVDSPLSVFNQSGRPYGKAKERWLNDAELRSATVHVLLNCEEIEPYLNAFTQIFNISNEDLHERVNAEFADWFSSYVHNPQNQVNNPALSALAWGPNRCVTSWPMYFVNGYRFHTDTMSKGKKTINSGVWVKGSTNANDESDYYGKLKDVIQLVYPGLHGNKVTLFECEWFDPTPNRGTKVHKDFKLVDIRHNRRYARFDPYIIASSARQVYYVPYPGKNKDKAQWWMVIKTKARNRVEVEGAMEIAFQDDNTEPVNPIVDIEHIDNLRDDNGDSDVLQDVETSRQQQQNNEEHDNSEEDDNSEQNSFENEFEIDSDEDNYNSE